MPSRYNIRVNAIRRILLAEWNPIGVGVPDDEYDSYIPTIVRLIQERADEAKLVSHLGGIERISMELRPDAERNHRVAKLLLAIND